MSVAASIENNQPELKVISVLIVDDHPLFCDALTMTVQQGLGATDIRTANCLENALETLQQDNSLDLIVLDLNLPDVDGVDGLVRLKNAAPSAPVIVVSSLSDNEIISAILAGGAAGFVAKDANREILVEAFQAVLSGETYTPESYAAHADQNSADNDIIKRLQDLTPQQANILNMICVGKLNKQIAFDLDIAETTVKAHITAILRKLHVQSRTQAAMLAQRANFNAILRQD